MAITLQESTEYTNLTASPPVIQDKTILGGQIAYAMFTATQSGVGDATSSFAVVKLPAGRVRLLGLSSHMHVNWVTAVATMDVGWDAYEDFSGATVVADPNGIDDGIDVDAVGFQTMGALLTGTGSTKVFESKEGVVIRLTSQDVALADGDTAIGYIAYSAE